MQTYKIAIVGDGGVGKSSLLDAKKSKNFLSNRAITVGVDFDFIPIEKSTPENGESQFLVMDLGGQKRFHFVHDMYIQGIKGAIILFDVSRFRTFQNIKKWISLIIKENSQIPILLIGNKCDLITNDEIKLFEKDLNSLIDEYTETCNLYGFIFTSAKEKVNINETFTICEEMILWEQKLRNLKL